MIDCYVVDHESKRTVKMKKKLKQKKNRKKKGIQRAMSSKKERKETLDAALCTVLSSTFILKQGDDLRKGLF